MPVPFASLADVPWAATAVGLATAVALFVAWRFLAARPAAPAEADAEEALCGVSRDRRVAPRRKGSCAEVDLAEEPGRKPCHAWVQDRSVGGLCLLAEEELVEGAALLVRPRGANVDWVPVVVRSCRPDRVGWEVHVQFVRTPSWNVLVLFG